MSIKIENRSNDHIIILFNGNSVEINDGEDTIFENTESKQISLCVQRKRIPQEYGEKPKKKFSIYEDPDKPLSHIQLKSELEFDCISSHAVITVEENVTSLDTLHEDVIFVGYKTSFSGAKQLKSKDFFANEEVKKNYTSTQIKNVVFPVGIVGIIITLLGLFCLISALCGKMIIIFENEISKLSAGVLSVGGVAVLSVFISNLMKIFKRIKELS